MGPLGQQASIDICPHCDRHTVVDSRLDMQRCDHCTETF